MSCLEFILWWQPSRSLHTSPSCLTVCGFEITQPTNTFMGELVLSRVSMYIRTRTHTYVCVQCYGSYVCMYTWYVTLLLLTWELFQVASPQVPFVAYTFPVVCCMSLGPLQWSTALACNCDCCFILVWRFQETKWKLLGTYVCMCVCIHFQATQH